MVNLSSQQNYNAKILLIICFGTSVSDNSAFIIIPCIDLIQLHRLSTVAVCAGWGSSILCYVQKILSLAECPLIVFQVHSPSTV